MKNIKYTDYDGVYVRCTENETVLGFKTEPQRLRAQLILENELSKGNADFTIEQKPVFDLCGPMLDVSRGAVMTPEAVCGFMEKCARMGFNMFMLYTEDVYKMPEYPMFGYMRGGYTEEQLKRIDDFAYNLGIEVIPCIQTLGHLSQYLHWGEVPSDVSGVLLAGDDKVYEFIETEIKTMRRAFRSNRIHIGMDEAEGLGRGKYLEKNGYRKCHDIFNEHLAHVLEITRKYNYEPIIWSDMYFSGNDLSAYYDEDGEILQSVIDSAPENVTLMFWDYYHKNYDYYHKKLLQQERFKNNESAFAGGVWTWDAFLPNFKYTLETMRPGLEAAIDHGVKLCLATVWSGTGLETDVNAGLAALSVFSEYCYRGKACTESDIYEIAEKIGGENRELIEAISDFWCGCDGAVRIGTALIYCDLLIDTLCYDVDYNDVIARYKKSLSVIEKYRDNENYLYYKSLFEAALGKAELLSRLRHAYITNDREYLSFAANSALLKLRKTYDLLYNEYKRIWEKSYMPFGYEKVHMRFGGLDRRMQNTAEIISGYLEGKREKIDELECERVSGINVTWKTAPFYTKG